MNVENSDSGENITSVNASNRKQNSVVTTAGFATFLLVAGCIAYLASSDDSSTVKKEPEKSEIRNTLGNINYTEASKKPEPPEATKAPETPPPVPPAMILQNSPPTTAVGQNPNAKPVITPLERKRNGGIIVAGDSSNPSQKTESGTATSPYAVQPAQTPPAEEKGLSASLKATQISGVSASVLPNRNFLITKGSTLDCTLKTALDSSLSGLATCQLTRDIYSANGKVVLLDKGSLVTGEYSGGMKMGQNRLFLLWNRVETPSGVIIEINSPSIDPIGRTGIDGWVDNHFADRFAAAIMVSLLQDATQAGQAYLQGIAGNGGTNTTTNISSTPQASTEIVKSILQQQAAIPPTLNKNQGDHIQIMIARDMDFSSVYTLKPVE